MKQLHFVIIGSGPAGIFAAEAIRERDKESSITMITADSGFAHSPVMLTYWMGEEVPQSGISFRDLSWSSRKKVDVRLNARVASLNPTSREVVLDDGRTIPYDRLLIATGGIPILLPVPGREAKGVAALRTLRDAEAIREGEAGIKEVIIIGGGFIGLKLACHLKERRFGVTVLEKEPKLASRIFDLKASEIIKRRLQEIGMRIETDVEVIEILDDQGTLTGVQLRDGRRVPCQRVIQAVGVRSNVEFLEGSGIELQGGIVVNERMETNLPGVYAAGDVTMTIDSITLERLNNATWPAASRQGSVAGWNMAGGNRTYVHNFALNALNLFGLRVMSAGHSHSERAPGVDVFTREGKESYRKIVMKDGKLIGFILIGDVSKTGFMLRMMKSKEEICEDPADLLEGSVSYNDRLPPHLGYEHGYLFR